MGKHGVHREHIGKDRVPMVAVDGSTATTTLSVDSAAIGAPGLVDVAAAGTVSPTSADNKLGFESRFLCKVWQHLFAETGV